MFWRSKLVAFLVVLGVVFGASAAMAGNTVHVVKKKQSLWGIARRYKVTVKMLRRANGLAKNDVIKPGQRLRIPNARERKKIKRRAKARAKEKRAEKKGTIVGKDRKWWLKQPGVWTQTQRTRKERGVNPCLTPNPGNGTYTPWKRDVPMGQLIMPQKGGLTRSGGFDVMIHFHGHEPVRKEWVRVMNGTVLVGIDLGIGSGPYLNVFSSPARFRRLLDGIERAMAKHSGRKKVHIRKLGLSAWSAGYGAIEAILRQREFRRKVDAVVLLDGLHVLKDAAIDPFVRFARAAKRRRRFMFASHSSIIPPGYPSTTQSMHYLIHKIGGKPRKARRKDLMGLELIGRYDRGNFHVRGYKGNDKMDHCAHIGLYRDVLKVHIKRRWRSPRGRKGS